VVPEAGAGISVARLVNRVEWYSAGGFPPGSGAADTALTRVSPFILVGLRFPMSWRLSLHLAASWASYSNEFRSFDREFDLGLSGWTFRPLLELRW
jgi:hypothetical protein